MVARAEDCPEPRWDYYEIGNTEFDLFPNEAGYIDSWFWGVTSCHPWADHEVLSGDWAAAIWYSGIPHDNHYPTDPSTAVWLTNEFICPDFSTNSSFEETGTTTYSNNLSNPFPGIDTFQSTITNGEITVRLDIELVQTTSCSCHPMGIGPAGYDQDYVMANSWLALFTYTITNISGETIDDLEFYQMLSSHPAGVPDQVLVSVYDPTDYNAALDSLSTYTPFNSVHTMGDFRYDITQWDLVDRGTPPGGDHIDFVGFSSTIEPDDYDNWHFRGCGGGRPSTGLHVSIEDRDLQGSNFFDEDQVAGAMMWYLPALDDDESTSITLALMTSTQQEQDYSDCDGDANGDKYVNQSDLGIVMAHYGTWVDIAFTDGDLDGDRYVGQTDLGTLLANYGYVCFP